MRAVLIAVVLLSSLGAVAEEISTWTDGDGVAHFTNELPALPPEAMVLDLDGAALSVIHGASDGGAPVPRILGAVE